MIGRCSSDSQHGRPDSHPANDGCSFFRYSNDDLRSQKDNQLALRCYFRSNPTLRGYWKRTIEIWQECASFRTTSQSLTGQVRIIVKKGWFFDLEILKIHQKINNEQDNNSVPDTSTIYKQKQPNRNEPPTSENGNATQPINAQPNNPEQTLSQEEKVNLENLKRIMNSEKTTLLPY